MNYSKRITSDNITELKDDEIFVFGSNNLGQHVGGAARIANLKFGAEIGIGIGLTGRCYAIPTIIITKNVSKVIMPMTNIKRAINKFIKYAEINHNDQTFLVTEIGCGIAGYTPEQIAPLFVKAVKINSIHLPKRFWNILINK